MADDPANCFFVYRSSVMILPFEDTNTNNGFIDIELGNFAGYRNDDIMARQSKYEEAAPTWKNDPIKKRLVERLHQSETAVSAKFPSPEPSDSESAVDGEGPRGGGGGGLLLADIEDELDRGLREFRDSLAAQEESAARRVEEIADEADRLEEAFRREAAARAAAVREEESLNLRCHLDDYNDVERGAGSGRREEDPQMRSLVVFGCVGDDDDDDGASASANGAGAGAGVGADGAGVSRSARLTPPVFQYPADIAAAAVHASNGSTRTFDMLGTIRAVVAVIEERGMLGQIASNKKALSSLILLLMLLLMPFF